MSQNFNLETFDYVWRSLSQQNATWFLILTPRLFLSDISEQTRKTKFTQNLSTNQGVWQNLKKDIKSRLDFNQWKTYKNLVNMCFWPKLKCLVLFLKQVFTANNCIFVTFDRSRHWGIDGRSQYFLSVWKQFENLKNTIISN